MTTINNQLEAVLIGIRMVDINTQKKVVKAGVTKLGNFITIKPEDLRASALSKGMGLADVSTFLLLQKYYINWRLKPAPKPTIKDELDEEVWDDYVIADAMTWYAPANGASATTAAAAIAPTVTVPTSLIDKSFGSFKWEAKNIPLLPKNKPIQDAYKDWEENFLSQMTLANVIPILDDCWVVSINS